MHAFGPRALPYGKTVNSYSSHKEKLVGPDENVRAHPKSVRIED
jgi:hypothetical protein